MIEIVGILVTAGNGKHARGDVDDTVRHQQRIARIGDQPCQAMGVPGAYSLSSVVLYSVLSRTAWLVAHDHDRRAMNARHALGDAASRHSHRVSHHCGLTAESHVA